MAMKRLVIMGLALVPGLAAGTAQAACPGDTQLEMNECASLAHEQADRRLNQLYRQLDKTPALVAAEKAWIAYRDAECAYQAQRYEGGSMQPQVYSSCLAALTEDRIRQLREDSRD